MTTVTTTGFRAVPGFARGLVRDLRVRWAALEAGTDYTASIIAFEDRASPEYLAKHPFGQVPFARVGNAEVFESGAIVFAIGMKSLALLPGDQDRQIETLSWMFAALNTIEPPILTLFGLDVIHAEVAREPVYRDATLETIRNRLARLADHLEGREYLTGSFSAADVLMATTLRFLRFTDIVAEFPTLSAYVARCEGRPAFQQALADQEADYVAGEALAA